VLLRRKAIDALASLLKPCIPTSKASASEPGANPPAKRGADGQSTFNVVATQELIPARKRWSNCGLLGIWMTPNSNADGSLFSAHYRNLETDQQYCEVASQRGRGAVSEQNYDYVIKAFRCRGHRSLKLPVPSTKKPEN
jgi:hypothetical protein